jgi:cytochrome c-type biogenesis protein
MINDLFTWLSELLSGNIWIAFAGSFLWGVLSILLSPCHLSSIPLIVGYINSKGNITLRNTFYISLLFALGILITIALIGLITASLGGLMGDLGQTGNYLVSIIFIVVGLYLIGIIKLPWEGANIRGTRHSGYLGSFVLGLLFGIGLGPCTFAYMAPVLGIVLQVSSVNFLSAVILLSAFAIGHCSVIVGAGTLSKSVQKYLNWTENSKIASYVKTTCGVLVIIGGIYMIYNTLF